MSEGSTGEARSTIALMAEGSGEEGRAVGWYPDPHFPDYERYWDGTEWGDDERHVVRDEFVLQERTRLWGSFEYSWGRLVGWVLLVVSVTALIVVSLWGNDSPVGEDKYNTTFVVTRLSLLGVIAAAILLVRAFVDRWLE